MIDQRQKIVNIFVAVCRSIDMDLAPELLPAEACLMGRTGTGSLQVTAYQGKGAEHGKPFQCEQNAATRPLPHTGKNSKVLPQEP